MIQICLLLEGSLFDGSGTNIVVSTAFGMTDTISGLIEDLSTVFSLLRKKKKWEKYTQRVISLWWYSQL